MRKGIYFHTRRQGKQNQAVLYVREGANGKLYIADQNVLLCFDVKK